jgi:15-cis-phytoene synthase
MRADVRTAQAYRYCESSTRGAAANFYYGIRLLPHDKRRAMCAVYAFARRIDDIGDGSLEAREKLRLLDAAARALDGLNGPPWGLRGSSQRAPGGGDPVMVALADARVRFDLPLDALHDLIAGVRMDVVGTSYESFEDLLLYCRRVAGSIGRLCLAIFGSRDPRAAARLAEDLGVAMQLTNIARDVREDAEAGRVYLPAQELVRYHLHDDGALGAVELVKLTREGSNGEASVVAGFGGGDVGQLYALMRLQSLRARDWFHRGMALVLLLDRRSAACVLAMTGIYRRLLGHIEERPDLALQRRISLPAHEKAWVASRAIVRGRRLPERHPAERLE